MKNTQQGTNPSGAPLNKRHGRQNQVQRTSISKESTSSSVSFKSDRSKGKGVHFETQPSPRVLRKRRTSAGSSCASIKSEGSPGYIKAKKRCSGSDILSPSSSSPEKEDVATDDVDSEPTSDGNESTTSCASVKSDRSNGKPVNFKEQPSPRVLRKRRASTGSTCASIKSGGSPGYIKAKKRCSGKNDKMSLLTVQQCVA